MGGGVRERVGPGRVGGVVAAGHRRRPGRYPPPPDVAQTGPPLMASVSLPVYIRIGGSAETEIGTVTVDRDEVAASVDGGLLRRVLALALRSAAAELESPDLEGDAGGA
ncbi:hypothetical protein [Solwaraspora sp. WMMD792]|uniref:hypothetical protein n=1 Tax=Solwaraspora sp. WMMD792 TaxID=3016099 RepID=UPI002415EF4C|nr:hypothetical protein [Solwaraspora sp. WMMD792]MDG4768803.1 hypothetical protein [Solwaraspora sp. WMMD792]MDG4768977.1 hypothetical protein [Solwaraspora sp. WMMD792]MDG4769002.1 hypothetical protein [Solwaraspora sp. WMMD792]